jgi:hypothetical protein
MRKRATPAATSCGNGSTALCGRAWKTEHLGCRQAARDVQCKISDGERSPFIPGGERIHHR